MLVAFPREYRLHTLLPNAPRRSVLRRHCERVQLFELKALAVLHARLLEEKACRDHLRVLVTKSPVDSYEEFRDALELVKRLHLNPATEPLVVETQRLFDSVKDRIEVCAWRVFVLCCYSTLCTLLF